VTHSETQAFRYNRWDDISGDLVGVGAIYRVTKVKFQMTYVFADQHSQNKWDSEYSNFKARNENRDTHFNAWHTFEIRGFRSRKLALVGIDEPPCCLNLTWYFITSLILWGYCFRAWFHSISVKQRYKYIKRVKC